MYGESEVRRVRTVRANSNARRVPGHETRRIYAVIGRVHLRSGEMFREKKQNVFFKKYFCFAFGCRSSRSNGLNGRRTGPFRFRKRRRTRPVGLPFGRSQRSADRALCFFFFSFSVSRARRSVGREFRAYCAESAAPYAYARRQKPSAAGVLRPQQTRGGDFSPSGNSHVTMTAIIVKLHFFFFLPHFSYFFFLFIFSTRKLCNRRGNINEIMLEHTSVVQFTYTENTDGCPTIYVTRVSV